MFVKPLLFAAFAMTLPGLAQAQGQTRDQAQAQGQTRDMLVARSPSCGCCGAWMQRMQAEGFAVTADNMESEALYRLKEAVGVPEEMASCHTAVVAGYVIEGHVPAADIRRLLAEAPEGVVGLAVPGMPVGAPGMEYQDIREAYQVHLIRADGSSEVYASYPEG